MGMEIELDVAISANGQVDLLFYLCVLVFLASLFSEALA